MRFSPSNWSRFETHNKKTTIRTREQKPGIKVAGHGSIQWGSWVAYPEKVRIHPYSKKCRVIELTKEDAVNDGFDSLCELILELGCLNKDITVDTLVYIHPVEKLLKHGGGCGG